MRATRDWRRRLHLVRPRAERLTPMRQPTSQDNVPALGTSLTSKAPREGLAQRLSAPAVQQNIDVDRAFIDSSARLLRDLAPHSMTAAQPPDPATLRRRQAVPGMGPLLRLVWLDDIHDRHRLPRVQDCASSCRVVKCAHESAGKRSGTSGQKIGTVHRTWAVSEAAVVCLVDNPLGQKDDGRLEKKYGPGKALTVLAYTRARAVYALLRRQTLVAMDTCMQG